MAGPDPFEEEVIRANLAQYLGHNATYSEMDPQTEGIMGETLRRIAEGTGIDFRLFVAENAPAELFVVNGTFARTPVVLSTSYIGLAAEIRRLMDLDLTVFSDGIFETMAEQLCLRLMAEASILHGDPDLGALALAWGETRQSVQFADTVTNWSDRWQEVNAAPLSEATMMLWYGPLTHELGHVASQSGQMALLQDRITEDDVAAALDHVLDGLPHYPDEIKLQIREMFAQSDGRSCVAAGTLVEEARADLFAFLMMVQLTWNAVHAHAARDLSPDAFVWEFKTFYNCIAVVTRCRVVAQTAARREIDRDDVLETTLAAPVAHSVRALLLDLHLRPGQWYLAYFDLDETAHAEAQQKLEAAFTDVHDAILHKVDLFEKGLARAQEFLLFHARRPSEPEIFDTFRTHLQNTGLALSAAPHFVDMARSFDAVSPFVGEIEKIHANPEAPLAVTSEGLEDYVVHFVATQAGPQLLTLPVQDMDVVFACHAQGQIEPALHAACQDMIGRDVPLQKGLIRVHRHERLVPTMVAQFDLTDKIVLAEGTREFDIALALLQSPPDAPPSA